MTWKYFKEEEFACKCGCEENHIKHSLIDKLDKIRERCGFPFHVTSGYRCNKHNREVGGSENSAHVYGAAADIHCEYSAHRYSLIGVAISEGIRRLGVADNFIHLDIAEDKDKDLIWTY